MEERGREALGGRDSRRKGGWEGSKGALGY